MELHLGIMNNTELAEWFGIKLITLNKGGCKAKKLKELEHYARFEEVKGKINILEIFIPVYEKKSVKIYKEIERSMSNKVKSGTAWTCVQMGNYYYLKMNEKYGGEEKTYRYRVSLARDNLWGKPEKGKNCHRVTVKMYRGIDPKDNVYESLTAEEKNIKNEIFKKYFDVSAGTISDALEDLAEGNIKKGDVVDAIGYTPERYREYVKEVSRALGCDCIVRATVVDDVTLRLDKKVAENS